MMSPDDLRPHSNNARTHSKKQLSELAASIKEFGFTSPVLIAPDRTILAGHGRVEAAKLAGLSQIPTICLSHLSPAQRRAYLLADNKHALNAGWNLKLLAVELEELNLSFDLPKLGFTTEEMDSVILDAKSAEPSARRTKEDAVPRMRAKVVSRLADVWQLDRHRLLNGDARDAQAYPILLQGEEIGMGFSDPPYNVPIDGHVCGSGRIRHREFAMGAGEMSREQFTSFLETSLSLLASQCRDGAICYVCMDWRHVGELSDAGSVAFAELKNICVWNKSNGGQSAFYRSKHELIFVFKVGSAPHVNNFGLGQNGRYRTNVWDYPGISSVGRSRLSDLKMHPTVKPVALVADAIRDCSRRGDIVCDPFAGSGTTLIAAHKTGRIARLIEYDPAYCDTIIRRFEAFTGLPATLSSTGQPFEEVAEERCGGGAGGTA